MEPLRTIGAWRAAWLFYGTAALAVDSVSVLLWLSVPAAAADLLFGLTREQRLLFTALAAVWVLWKLFRGLAAFLPDLAPLRFAALAERALPALRDRLAPAIDLSRGRFSAGSSPEFAREHIEETSRLLSASPRPEFVSPGASFTVRRLAFLGSGVLAAAAAVWLDPGVFGWFLRPFSARSRESILVISPGDASVAKGLPFTIEAAYRSGWGEEPELRIRAAGERWTRGFMTDAGGGRFRYSGAGLSSDLSYRFRYKEFQSRVYRLRALEPPELEDTLFSVSPPAYTGQKAVSYPYLPSEAGVLKGGLVSVSGRRSRDLSAAELMFENGTSLPLAPAAGGRLSAEFIVDGDVSYRLFLRGRESGAAAAGERRAITALCDGPPSVEVLSPAFGELESAPEEEINAVYEASDDIGLESVRLIRAVSVSGVRSAELSMEKEIRVFPGPSERRVTGETELPIYDLPDGAEAEFAFSACDRSPSPAGPVCSRSGAVRIKVSDFSGRHAAAYAGMEALRKEIASLKDRENGIISGLEQGRAFSAAEMADYASAWKRAAGLSGLLGAELGRDPYMGSGALARYGLFMEDMVYGAGKAAEKAAPGTVSGPPGQAADLHRSLKSSLEKGEADLESIMRSEDARASLAGFENMAGKAAEMSEELSGAGSEADWDRLSRTLEKISAELARINSMLGERPPQKSDGRVFALPAGSALETAGELAAAIGARDAGKAAALAAALAEKLSRMRRVMEEYAEYRASEEERRESGEETTELSGRWRALYEAQSAETGSGRELEEKLLARADKARAAALSELSASMPEIASGAAAAGRGAPGAYQYAARAGELLRAGDADGARASLASALAEIEKSTCVPCAPELRAAAGKARAGMEALSRLVSDAALLDAGDLALFPPASERQEKLRVEAAGLAAHVSGGYSGAMAGRLLERLDKAGGHMYRAVLALSSRDIRAAAGEQLKALDELDLGGRDLDDMLGRRKSASAGMGASGMGAAARPSGVFVRPAPGMDASPVKLPKAGDYVPPADLRKRVMESLRERYPSSQKDLIEGYLKNIAK